MNQEQEKIYDRLVSKYNFDTLQRFQIKLGLKNNINVSLYAKPEYNADQMKEIRFGLENNVDVSLYIIWLRKQC